MKRKCSSNQKECPRRVVSLGKRAKRSGLKKIVYTTFYEEVDIKVNPVYIGLIFLVGVGCRF